MVRPLLPGLLPRLREKKEKVVVPALVVKQAPLRQARPVDPRRDVLRPEKPRR